MSITRAFTTKRVKQSLEAADDAKHLRRTSNSTSSRGYGNLGSGPGSVRLKISGPVELIHTTNMLSYNAPDIFPRQASSASAQSTTSASTTSKSDDESDAQTNASTPPTSPDIPSAPLPSAKMQANHLSSYFTPPVEKAAGRSLEERMAAKVEVPVIPQRAPSHSKKPSDPPNWSRPLPARLSETSTHSAATKASSTFSRASAASTSTSIASRSSASPAHMAKESMSSLKSPTNSVTPPVPQHRKQPSASRHPFGQELAQVSELAEEFSTAARSEITAAQKEFEQEEQEMRSRGLRKVSADDYLSDIRTIASRIFGEARPLGTVWI